MAIRMMAKQCLKRLPVVCGAPAPSSLGNRLVQSLKPAVAAIRPTSSTTTLSSVSSSRSFAVSAVSNAQLQEALKSEIEYEEQNDDVPTKIKQPPKGWTLQEDTGNAELKLKKSYNGEDIEVTLNLNDQIGTGGEEEFLDDEGEVEGEEVEGRADEEDLPEVDQALSFVAAISKGRQTLSFGLSSDGSSYFDIEYIKFEPNPASQTEVYDGPAYEELDPKLQDQFSEYLEERGISEALAGYLLEAADAKEQKEYVNWLKNIHQFI